MNIRSADGGGDREKLRIMARGPRSMFNNS